jgi:CDP-2,3-bis-(O-geranylgeranyl)-sn-glycerol synthase
MGSIILVLIFYPDWFIGNYWDGSGWIALITLLVAVPLLHRGVNIIGYKMGKKDVPW